MSDRTNHRRVLCFAVSGVLLGGCASNEPAKTDTKSEAKTDGKTDGKTDTKQPEVPKFAINPGPDERKGNVEPPKPEPTTAVAPEPPPPGPEPDYVNEGPVKEPPEPTKAEPEKRVNTGPVKEPPPPEPKPIIKVNPGPEG